MRQRMRHLIVAGALALGLLLAPASGSALDQCEDFGRLIFFADLQISGDWNGWTYDADQLATLEEGSPAWNEGYADMMALQNDINYWNDVIQDIEYGAHQAGCPF